MAGVYSCRGMPTINRFFDSDAFFQGLMGPFGSGKSSACVIKLANLGVAQEPGPDGVRRSRWAVIRNSYRQLEDTTIKTFFQWFSPHVHGTWRASAHEFTLRSLKASHNEPACEIEFMFRALDRPDQLANLLSTEYTGGWINEGREVPWAIFEGLSGRVGRYPAKRDGGATWSGVIADTNPPDTESDWYRFFEERKGHEEAVEDLAKVIPGMTLAGFSSLFKQPSGLAPNAENLANLPVGYYQRLAVGKSKDWIKIYIDGQYGFTTDGKAVFPEYLDAMHCPTEERQLPRLYRDLEVFRSWDFGLTPACVWSQITPDGRWQILDEMTSTSMGADRFSDEVLAHSGRAFRGCTFVDVGDEAGGQRAQTDEKTCFQILQAKGIAIMPAPQTLVIRLEGTRRPLNSLVGGRPQFVIHPRCKTLRRALQGGYHFRRIRVSGESYTSEPNKNPYCVPMETRALTPSGWKSAHDLRVGDAIYSYDMDEKRIVVDKLETINFFGGKQRVVRWAGKHASFISTSAHRNVVLKRSGITEIIDTENLNTGHALMCAASQDLPRKYAPFSDEFISLAAWVAAEGHYRATDGAILLCQSRSHNPAYVEYLSDLLKRFPGTIEHDADSRSNPEKQTWLIRKETAWMLRHWMPGKVPSAEFVARMSNLNRRRFLYEFVRADGHAGGALPDPGDLSRARDFTPKAITPRIFQKSRACGDALQMMAVLSGLRTHARTPNLNGEAIDGQIITILPHHGRFSLARKRRSDETTEGVWCPTTGRGTWICMQEGQTFITGNSHVADALTYAGAWLFGEELRQYVGAGDSSGTRDEMALADRTRSAVTGY